VRFPCVHAAATTPVQRTGVLVAQNHPSVSAFPDSTIVSACTSSFSRFARRSLTLRPAHSRSHLSDRYPRASDISSPPCLPRLLPAGAVAGWALHPLEKRRLVTAHVVSGPWHPGFPPSVIVPSTDLQVRCHGSELTDETCHFRTHAPQQDERSCTAIRSPRRRSQKRRRHVEAERLRHDQVNDEAELGRLLDRKIGGLRPQQNLVD